jgi:hypothetical protein
MEVFLASAEKTVGARNSPQEAFRQIARHSGEQCSIGFQPVSGREGASTSIFTRKRRLSPCTAHRLEAYATLALRRVERCFEITCPGSMNNLGPSVR